MQIKASMGHHTPTRIPKMKRSVDAKCDCKYKTTETLMCSWWDHTWFDHFGKLLAIYLKLKLNTHLHYDPQESHSWRYTQEEWMHMSTKRKTSMKMFIAVSFIIAKKQINTNVCWQENR